MLSSVFGRFAGTDSRWPELHLLLMSVHRECLRVETRRERSEPDELPAPTFVRDEESSVVPGSTLVSALDELGDEERAILWRALLGRAPKADWRGLAAALERLEVAAANQSIPGEEQIDWPE